MQTCRLCYFYALFRADVVADCHFGGPLYLCSPSFQIALVPLFLCLPKLKKRLKNAALKRARAFFAEARALFRLFFFLLKKVGDPSFGCRGYKKKEARGRSVYMHIKP